MAKRTKRKAATTSRATASTNDLLGSMLTVHEQDIEAETKQQEVDQAEGDRYFNDFVRLYDAAWNQLKDATERLPSGVQPAEKLKAQIVDAITSLAKLAKQEGIEHSIRLATERCLRLAKQDPTGKAFNLPDIQETALVLLILLEAVENPSMVESRVNSLNITQHKVGKSCQEEVHSAGLLTMPDADDDSDAIVRSVLGEEAYANPPVPELDLVDHVLAGAERAILSTEERAAVEAWLKCAASRHHIEREKKRDNGRSQTAEWRDKMKRILAFNLNPQSVEQSKETPPPKTLEEGPYGGNYKKYQWVHEEDILEQELQRQTHRLAIVLHSKIGVSVSFDELVGGNDKPFRKSKTVESITGADSNIERQLFKLKAFIISNKLPYRLEWEIKEREVCLKKL